jgi:hypothetical protein
VQCITTDLCESLLNCGKSGGGGRNVE